MKKIFRQIGVVFVATALFVSVLPVSLLAQVESSMKLMAPYIPYAPQEAGAFSDVPANHPFATTIASAKTGGLVKGNPDGSFAPERTINRAEFITMLIASVTATPKGTNCFTDVRNEWYATRVCEAKSRGLISGFPDGSFQPSKNITLAEAALISAKAQGIAVRKATASEPWYKPALVSLESRAALPATVDTVDTKISRAQTIEIIWRLKNGITNRTTKKYTALVSVLPTINSCSELQEKIQVLNYRTNNVRMYSLMQMKSAEPESVGAAEDAADESAPTAAPAAQGAGEAAADYSSTNVQVAGVDEADVIKNDGEYIYMVARTTVRIVKAYPADRMEQVAKIELPSKSFTPTDLYIHGNKLVVIGDDHANQQADYDQPQVQGKMMWIRPQQTGVYVLDISNKRDPKVERTLRFDGNQVSSRRIGATLFLVVNNTPDYYTIMQNKAPIENVLPFMTDSRLGGNSQAVASCSQVRFMPHFDTPNFLTVAGINIESPAAPVKRNVVMGGGENIYASAESLYVAATRYDYPNYEAYDIWSPPQSQEKTTLTRFAITPEGEISFATQGDVPGHIINQFAMDEEGSAFRIATTIAAVSGRFGGMPMTPQTNSLYILDRANLGTRLGSLTNLAPGEQIHSVRFMGARAYMVTFKNIDPFFVLDVSDPRAPRVLGELKIPGYSDYLHPYDENHIIGFGKEAVDPRYVSDGQRAQGFDFAWYQGMKVALFDVTDVANPKLQFKEVIGDRGTDSELLRNHKALFFDKARGLIAFPVTVHEVKNKTPEYQGQDPAGIYGTPVFQGAYVYHLDLTSGFTLRGRVTHLPANYFTENPNNYGYFGDNALAIKRIISIGENLYTISPAHIKALFAATLELKKEIDVPEDPKPEPPYLYPIPL